MGLLLRNMIAKLALLIACSMLVSLAFALFIMVVLFFISLASHDLFLFSQIYLKNLNEHFMMLYWSLSLSLALIFAGIKLLYLFFTSFTSEN